ncbi:MAG: hypothetical protein A2W25_00450 [candidate division Zixibacteria bacterium RBG_16_53_22]|nr:MAG: hypothetical protein A2W25_00450 [candidate division Zixibacteria bacterium RBG_16_53_22]
MNLSSRARRLPIRVLGPLIIMTVLIVYSQVSAQEPIRVALGNPDCTTFDVPAQGDVAFPVWVDFPYPVGAGSMVFIIVDSVVTEWLGVNFLLPWDYQYNINSGTLSLSFAITEYYPHPPPPFRLADLIFAIDASLPYYGDTIQVITVSNLGFSDTTGYILFPDSHCVSPLCIECQTSVDDPIHLPEQITCSAYPNPFNSSVAINLSLPREGYLNLSIYDIAGRVVRCLYDGRMSGSVNILWDGADESGRQVSSGIYFYEIEYDGLKFGSKTTLLK